MDFDSFFKLFNLTYVDFDGYYGDQCVDLAQFWSRAIGGPRFTGNAIDIYNQAGTFFTQVPNTPDGVPQKGDIVIFGAPYGLYIENGVTKYAGHIGISTGKGDVNTFEIFEQNDPIGAKCQAKTYNYDALQNTGWLHPKQLPTSADTGALQTQIKALQTKIDNAKAALG